MAKDKTTSFSEDDGKIARANIDDLTKKIASQIETLCVKKAEEVESL
jgi:ribosome recycling factor